MKKLVSLLGCLVILTIWLAPSALAEKGVINKALALDGDKDYVDCGNDASLNPGNELTVEACFMHRTEVNTWATIVERWGFYQPGQRSYWFGIGTCDIHNQEGYFSVFNSIDTQFGAWTIGISLNDNQWHHMAGVVNGNKIQLYLDGAPIEEQPFDGTIQQTSVQVSIGGEETTNSFNGLIDEVRIWNVARTQEQIRRWMNRRIWWHPKRLVGYWRMDDPLDSRTAKDYSGNGNDGTLVGDAHFVFAPRAQEAPSINPTSSLKTEITMTWGHLKSKH